MEVIYLNDYKKINSKINNLSLVLGYFDGLHIGHQQLINFAKFNSRGPIGVITFDRPLKSIEGSLMSLETKIEYMKELEVDYLFVIKVDDNFRHMSYIDFINKILKRLFPLSLYCGNDFTFGYEAKGNVSDLKMAFANVKVINYINDSNFKKISSSNIRKLISSGEVKEANFLLGRPYIICGSVEQGYQEGTKIGIPTANLNEDCDYVKPKNGVYITKCKVDNKIYKSVTNVGKHPTVNMLPSPLIETHIIDLNKNIYGKKITIFFIDRLRDEIKFDSLDELKKQIDKDISDTLEYFNYKV